MKPTLAAAKTAPIMIPFLPPAKMNANAAVGSSADTRSERPPLPSLNALSINSISPKVSIATQSARRPIPTVIAVSLTLCDAGEYS